MREVIVAHSQLIVGWATTAIGSCSYGKGDLGVADPLRSMSAGDIGLMIDLSVMPYGERFDLPELLECVKEQDVTSQGVLITNGLWTNQKAHRIWPA